MHTIYTGLYFSKEKTSKLLMSFHARAPAHGASENEELLAHQENLLVLKTG